MNNNKNKQPKKIRRLYFLFNGYSVFFIVFSMMSWVYANYEYWNTDEDYNNFVKEQGYNPRSMDHKTQDRLRRQYDFDNSWHYNWGLTTTTFLPFGSK